MNAPPDTGSSHFGNHNTAAFDALIVRCQAGDKDAHDVLARFVHRDFYRMAQRLCANQKFAHSLHPTNLVNETFLRLLKQGIFQEPQSRRYVYGAASQAMRNAIVDHLRKRNAQKRQAKRGNLPTEELADPLSIREAKILEIDEALGRLEQISPRLANVVTLRFFLGMTVEEVSQSMELSISSVEKAWREARAWLYRELH